MKSALVLFGLQVLFHLCLAGEPTTYEHEDALGSSFVMRCVREAIQQVDEAYKYSRDVQKQKISKRSLTPVDFLAHFKTPAAETRRLVRSADYMDTAVNLIRSKVNRIHKRSLNATELLTEEDLETIARITGCQAQIWVKTCQNDCWADRYRSINGICNNKVLPHLGAANRAFTRWLPQEYEDGFTLPKGWTKGKKYKGFPLPNVREVSNKIMAAPNVKSDEMTTHMFVQWAQWMDHDMDLTPVSPSIKSFSGGINCEMSCENKNPCFPIEMPAAEMKKSKCMPFSRSAPVCGSGNLGYLFGDVNTRQQINALTSFVDASNVYGSSQMKENRLRNLSSDLGLMAVNELYRDHGLEYLPFYSLSKQPGDPCAINHKNTVDLQSEEGIPCFVAGDDRSNEQLGLLSFHTLFVREHNRMARELKTLNPHWDGETVYQETRKIMGAYFQIINYRDYVHRVIGEEAMRKYLPKYKGYDETVDPRISNVFATAAFRYAHATIMPTLFRSDEKYQEHKDYPNLHLHNAFFSPWRLVSEGGLDPIMCGLLGNPAKKQTQNAMMNEELRQRLFEPTREKSESTGKVPPLDLSALNLQRGRDHGLPGYNAWRKFCGLSQPKDKQELALVLGNHELAQKFIDLYGTPDNIDLWAVGIAEPFGQGAKVGTLFACLIGTQFAKLRDGDRFWWENSGVFTECQRDALREVTLSRIICDNTHIKEVPKKPFDYHPYPEGFVKCDTLPKVDLTPWKDDIKGHPNNCDELEPETRSSRKAALFSKPDVTSDFAHPNVMVWKSNGHNA
ncbi:myeloperoxidase [Latimeria chalumnae]|uniref:myeloperoxidase n=1 Tax=Latimeria chalumnae TaxID=7897 RepID=UPI0006D90E70|nr:PREDICTED: myeloperoxidase [Latimeria chalumnae]|eukprot:XP_014341738.1 PREDICTED: myeloperoxidase [Latimeria chalumnae]